MKYVADRIYISPEETATSLRKKVADRLGVSPSGMRVNVISRRWWRGKSQGAIEVRVEAETNEFIRNTAYFVNNVEIAPLPEVKCKLPPVVIGFGVRGSIAAYVLAKKGLKPIVLEKSADPFLAHGSRSGGAIQSGTLFCPDDLDAGIRAMLQEDGITFDTVDAHQYLPPAFIRSLMQKLRDIITDNGGKILFNATFTEIKTFFGKPRAVVYETAGKKESIKTKDVIFTDGRTDDVFYLGLAVESSLRGYNQFIYGKPSIDPRYPAYFALTYFTPPESQKCILMTGLSKATLCSAENQSTQMLDFSEKGKNAVSYLGISLDKEEALRLCRQNYIAGKPQSIPWSTVADFLSGKDPLRLKTVKPADITRTQLTPMKKIYGEKNAATIRKALFQFGKAFPYLLQDDAIVGGMVLLRGTKEDPTIGSHQKHVHVSSVSAEKSLDFAAMASAGYRAAVALILDLAK